MKKNKNNYKTVLVSLLLTTAPVFASDREALLDAIKKVESNNNHRALGDGGLARGAYQIHRAYWKDGCEYLGVNWSYDEAYDPIKSRKVVNAYLDRYGKGKTTEQLARIHNGGPNGHKMKSTIKYWNKVKKELK